MCVFELLATAGAHELSIAQLMLENECALVRRDAPLSPVEAVREGIDRIWQTMKACIERGIATEAWAPLGKGALLEDPTITAVARDCGRTSAQVLIRWHLQLGNIVIPKSVNPERIASNFDVFDFVLSENDMSAISSLDDGDRLGPNPRTFDFTGR